MNDSLKAQCIAEFLGTGLFLFFGIGCLSALKVAGASLDCGRSASFGVWGSRLQST